MNANRLKNLVPTLRKLGPYLLVELLLPGGTLVALLLWLSQAANRPGVQTLSLPVEAPASVARLV